MNDRPEQTIKAATMPMGFGSPSMATAAPVGAVSRKDRQRAAKTSLRREGPSRLLLRTAIPGSVLLQRQEADGTWETVDRRPASRVGLTRIELPGEATSPTPTFRAVFSPRNTNINSWISESLDG